ELFGGFGAADAVSGKDRAVVVLFAVDGDDAGEAAVTEDVIGGIDGTAGGFLAEAVHRPHLQSRRRRDDGVVALFSGSGFIGVDRVAVPAYVEQGVDRRRRHAVASAAMPGLPFGDEVRDPACSPFGVDSRFGGDSHRLSSSFRPESTNRRRSSSTCAGSRRWYSLSFPGR